MAAITDVQNPVYAQLCDKELLELVRGRGRTRLAADWRFAAPLPEVERRGLDLKAGFQDLEHFSALEGGASGQVVSRVRNLEAKLGVYPKLWSLMDEGRVGWSKLEVIADVVTPETEPEWQQKVLDLSKRTLEDHVRAWKQGPVTASRQSRDQVEPGELPRPNAATGVVPAAATAAAALAAAAPSGAADVTGAAVSTFPAGTLAAAGGSRAAAESVPPSQMSLSGRSGAVVSGAGSSSNARDGAGPLEMSAEFQGGIPGTLPSCPEAPGSDGVAEPFGPPQGADDRAMPDDSEPLRTVTRRLSLEIDPVAEARLREMQRQVELKTGSAVSLGDLVSAFIHEAWEGGRVAGRLAAAVPPEASDRMADRTDDNADKAGEKADPAERADLADRVDSGERAATGGTGSGSWNSNDLREDTRCSRSEPAPGVDGQSPPAGAKGGAELKKRSAPVPLPPRGILEVVYRPEGSSTLFMATASGLVQVPALLLERLPSVAVDYQVLVEKAVAAAKGAKGDRIPAAVQRAVLARSGGRCEARGCRRRAVHFHHVIPRAEGGSHHPDNIRHVCGSDHEAGHSDLLEDTPAGLVRRASVSGGPQNEADRAYQAIRRGIKDGRGGDPMP